MTHDAALVEALSTDYRQAALSERDRAMLDYAVKLTLEPWTVQPGDISRLRDSEFSDTDILDIAQTVGYFAYVNRIADGLGVGVEPEKWDEIRAGE